jgi:hypothetical protein
VFATGNCSAVTRDGITVHLQLGQVWAADDPICLAHQDDGLFADEPPLLCRTTKPETILELRGR